MRKAYDLAFVQQHFRKKGASRGMLLFSAIVGVALYVGVGGLACWFLVVGVGITDGERFFSHCVVGLGVVGGIVALRTVLWVRRHDFDVGEFRRWLEQSQALLTNQGAVLKDSDRLRSYSVHIASIIPFARTTADSRMFVARSGNSFWRWLDTTVMNLFMGWWNLPVGPIFGFAAIVFNLGGGTSFSPTLRSELEREIEEEVLQTTKDVPWIRARWLCLLSLPLSFTILGGPLGIASGWHGLAEIKRRRYLKGYQLARSAMIMGCMSSGVFFAGVVWLAVT